MTPQSNFLVFALASLVMFWLICFIILATKTSDGENTFLRGPVDPHAAAMKIHSGNLIPVGNLRGRKSNMLRLNGHILSRSKNVTVTADARGNLGPVEVIIQETPGKNWLKDRWQAAINMHGKAIPGSHWVQLDFGREVLVEKVVLDWEAAFADDYLLLASMEPIDDESKEGVWTLFDGTNPEHKDLRSVLETGQSPGVKTKTPLHVIHSITPLIKERPFRFLKVFIHRPGKNGWGVSLWQVDVYGLFKSEVMR
jgi:hypothetical protein